MKSQLTQEQLTIIRTTEEYVFAMFDGEGSGHDWWHIKRVSNLAQKIAEQENADRFITQMAALLHDVADEKLNVSVDLGLKKIVNFLSNQKISSSDCEHILEIINHMSYKGGTQIENVQTLEGKIVQDADRLDALGAIGIARTMCYSGHTNRPIYDPQLKPRENMTLEEYRNGKGTAIMHFYEKLLKLTELMNTEYGKKLAEGRHQYLLDYLEQFYDEWNGER